MTDTPMNDTTPIQTHIQTDLPRLCPTRINQMARLACAQTQQCRHLPLYRAWIQKWFGSQATLNRRIAYGFGTLALTTACLAFVVLSPTTAPTISQSNALNVTVDTEISDMMLYDLLEDLT